MTMTIVELATALESVPADKATVRRFLAKIEEGPEPIPGLGPCIRWTATPHISSGQGGYGAFKVNGKVIAPYRWLWRTLHPNHTLPPGFDLDHVCHDGELCPGGPTCPHRTCVIHIEPKTRADNLRRGAGWPGAQFRKDWCDGTYGVQHNLRDPRNVYVPPGRENERHCKPCNREASRRYKARVADLRARGRHAEQREIGQLALL